MKRNNKRDALLKKYATLQAQKQSFDSKFNKIANSADEINKIKTMLDKQDSIFKKSNPIDFLSYKPEDENNLRLYYDSMDNYLNSGIQSYYMMNQFADNIENNQNNIINISSGSTASSSYIMNTLISYAQSPHCDASKNHSIEIFINDVKSIDRTAIKQKLDKDLYAILPELVERHTHAWASFNSGKEQNLRDACTHIREILDHFIKKYNGVKKLRKCHWYDKSKLKPNRSDRITFLLKEVAKLDENDPDYASLKNLSGNLAYLMDSLSSVTHWGDKDRSKVEELIIQTEDFLLILFKKGITPFIF